MCSINRELFQAWRGGDENARNRIWLMVWRHLYREAELLFQDEEIASDALNKAFVEINENINNPGFFEWQGENSFYNFVRIRKLNRIRDIFRTRGRNRIICFSDLSAEEEVDQTTPSPDASIIDEEQSRRFWECIGSLNLTVTQRKLLNTVLNLLDEGYTRQRGLLPEAQKQLGITRQALDNQMNRLRKILQRCIDKLRE